MLDSGAGGFLEIVGGNVNKLPFSLISGKNIRTFEDLRGKTVGVSSIEAGSSSLVMKLLAARGLEYPRDYNMRAVGPIRAVGAVAIRRDRCRLQGAPLNYIAIDQGFIACASRGGDSRFQFTSLNVDRRWAAANRDTIRKFMRAFVRAHHWFFANRAGTTPIAMAETRISRITRSAPGTNTP